MKLNTIICSYAFFALLVFNMLALLSSEFLPIFSQVFLLLARDGRIYDIFSSIFLCLAILTLLIVPVRIYSKRAIFGKTAPFIVTIISMAILCVLCILLFWLWDKAFLKDIGIMELETTYDDFTLYSYITSVKFVVFITCWILLVIMPLLYKSLVLKLNIKNRLSKSLLILEPNMTTIVIFMCAIAFHPYFSNLQSKYIYIPCFIISSCLLIYVIFKDNVEFGFYEYANIIFLAFGILCFVLCSESMLRSDFFNAQFTFYMLGIYSWCASWAYNQEIVSNEIFS